MRLAFRCTVVVMAVLAPAVLAVGVAAGIALWQVEQAMRRTAEDTLVAVERMADEVRLSLDGYRTSVGAECDDALVSRFRSALEEGGPLRHVGLFASDLTVRCSDSGPRSFPLIAGSVPTASDHNGLLLAAQKAVVEPSAPPVALVVLAVRGPLGDGAFAMVDAHGLLDQAPQVPDGVAANLTLRLANGVPVLQLPESAADGAGEAAPFYLAWLGLAPLTVSVPSSQMPLQVEVGSSSPSVGEALRSSLFIGLPAGLMLGAGAGLLATGGAMRDWRLRQRLRRALSGGEIVVEYQPLVRLSDERCVGAEALMRWRHPRRGMIDPDDFIPLVEESGGIIALTRQLMEQVARDLPAMIRHQPEIRISINLAAVHLEAATLAEDVLRTFSERGLTRRVIFEATERQLIIDEATAETCIKELHDAGMAIYLDDFGTGHSSLAYLQRFPVDGIKIAKRFVADIGTEAPQRSVIDAIITMGQNLDLEMIAEGVETEEQAGYLKDAAVGYGQGYYWAPPLPLADFLVYLHHDCELAAG